MSESNKENEKKNIIEKEITKTNGLSALLTILISFFVDIAVFVGACYLLSKGSGVLGGILLVLTIIMIIVLFILCLGFHIINPNEAMVFTLFGNYYGTIKKPGFYYINPFAGGVNPAGKTSNAQIKIGEDNVQGGIVIGPKKVSTKVMTLNNEKQKVNDALGNPIIIGAVVIWKVSDPTKAVFNVDNYKRYLSTQCDSSIRNIATLYPYDAMDEEETVEKTLRGSSLEIAQCMTKELQDRVSDAGLEIIEVRITHLSYSEEIAAAMLQRQQAVAVIAARKKIVEGAVSMVKMAIDELGEEEIVLLDEERKAAMVSNLLVVLCGNKEAQPIVNSGSIY